MPKGYPRMPNCVRRWLPKLRREHARSLACAESVAGKPINPRYMPNCYMCSPAKCVGRSARTRAGFQEHESFVEFGRHLARADGIEDTFRRVSYVSGQVSAGHI